MNPRPSGGSTAGWFANRTFFGLRLSVYQAELPAHWFDRRGWFAVKTSWWGRRRDILTYWRWFEPAPQAPLAKAKGAFQACTLPSYARLWLPLYATAATTGAEPFLEYVSLQ